jgi:hypothetical protein
VFSNGVKLGKTHKGELKPSLGAIDSGSLELTKNVFVRFQQVE